MNHEQLEAHIPHMEYDELKTLGEYLLKLLEDNAENMKLFQQVLREANSRYGEKR